MKSIREVAAEKKSRYKRFADMTWPTVDGDLAWRLRYAPDAVTAADKMYLASVLNAYEEMINANQKKRNLVCRELRKEN